MRGGFEYEVATMNNNIPNSINLEEVELQNEHDWSKTNEGKFIEQCVYEDNEGLAEYVEQVTNGDEELKKFITAFLVTLIVHKRGSVEAIWGLLRYQDKENPQAVLDAILWCIQLELCKTTDSELLVKYQLSEEHQKQLSMFSFPLPSVIPMKKVKSINDSPYSTIKTGCILLNQVNPDKDKEYSLDVVNKMQEMTFKVNETVAKQADDHWDVTGTIREGESYKTFKQRVEQFDEFSSKTMEVIERMKDLPLHFQVKYDKRGRNYTLGYHLNPQGKEYQKAILELYNAERVTNETKRVPDAQFTQYSGLDYLKIDVASTFGLDKKTWEERLQWFEEHKDNLRDPELLKKADSLPMYLAAVNAWEDTVQGKPTGYCCNLDATSSGPQLLSALLGDRSLAENCNVLPDKDEQGKIKRIDLYSEIYAAMCQIMGQKMHTQFNAETMKLDAGASYEIKRAHMKYAVMRSFYGSTLIIENIFGKETPEEDMFKHVMELAAPEGWAYNEMLTNGWNKEAIGQFWTMPDGFDVTCLVEGKVNVQLNYNGQEVTFAYRKDGIPAEKGRCLCANAVHSVDGWICREMVRCLHYNPETVLFAMNCLNGKFTEAKTSKYQLAMFNKLLGLWRSTGLMSIRILDFITPETAKELTGNEVMHICDVVRNFPEKPIDFMMIHDCFRVHPMYCNYVRYHYTRLLSEINKSAFVTKLTEDLSAGDMTAVRKEDFSDEILTSEYALS